MDKQTFTQEDIDDWKAYERVRMSGRWNMLTHATQAAAAARLSQERYLFTLEYYDELKEAAMAAK